MKRIKNNRAPGVSKVSIDMMKAGGEECLVIMADSEEQIQERLVK